MQNLKYYVLGKKDSPLLQEYLEKYYQLLISQLKNLQKKGFLIKEITGVLLEKDNRNFLLNADISSLIQSVSSNFDTKVLALLEREISILLDAGITSEKLNLNSGIKIKDTSIRLSLDDNNPYNQFEAHPDHIKTGGILGWGVKSEEEWLDVYEKTFKCLQELAPGIYDELNQIISKIIPLGTSESVHNSASYKECIGHLYLGYTLDSHRPEINNLEAIIHESSHNKLNLLMQFDPLLLNPIEYKYYSAIRPDARHLQGVFIGYHAFAPTMYILMKAYKAGFLGVDEMWLEKIVLYYLKTKFLQKVIKKYADLTDLGKEVSQEIDYVIVKMDTLFKELQPSTRLIAIAKKRQVEHFMDVNKNYKQLKY